MYQALYRKWRPLLFADVVGQKHITDTLRNQISNSRLSHAYLFTGTRGTGKTTCAKILSRAVNCEHPIDGDPCNACPSCRGILDGSILDVVEIDAASNNGVDNIRDIREETRYTPAVVKKRVYIIDEVHMLSQGAFNALLKTLEEPPPHVLFILATTEIHKVPATILSRCQRFDFRRISPHDIIERLMDVAAREGIPLKEDGVKMIARLADGAMRDALSILDRTASGAIGDIDEAVVAQNVGILAGSSATELMEVLKSADLSSAINLLSEYYISGRDLSAVFEQLLGLIRDMLLVKTSKDDVSALLSPAYTLNAVKNLCQDITSSKLIAFTGILQESLTRMNRAANKRIEAELCMVRLCALSGENYDTLTGRIEALEEKINSGAFIQTASEGNKKTQKSSNDAPPWENDSTAKIKESKPEKPTKQKPVALQSSPEWPQLIQSLTGKLNIAAHTNLKLFGKGIFSGNTLTIIADDAVTCQLVNTPEAKQIIAREAQNITRQAYTVKVIEESESSAELFDKPNPVDSIVEKAKKLNIELTEL